MKRAAIAVPVRPGCSIRPGWVLGLVSHRTSDRGPSRVFRLGLWVLLAAGGIGAGAEPGRLEAAWGSALAYRVSLGVDPRGRQRSDSPAAVDIDFQKILETLGETGHLDPQAVEVFVVRQKTIGSGAGTQPEPVRVAHRLDHYYGLSKVTLHFVLPDHRATNVLVYFDTVESGRGDPRRYTGLVGDGDLFREAFQRREVNASHFDQFVDFDGDGDLDLFKGGVEPYVYCYENIGSNRLVERGRLSSGGRLFVLPASPDHRSWVTVAFHDLDKDGDQDFFPSFNDGPDRGRIVFYRNTTRENGGVLTFERLGPLLTRSGLPLAGGAQAGGWFPSIVFVQNWDGSEADSNRVDALVGSNQRCWLYRGAGRNAQGLPLFADAVPVQAGGTDINLVNPRFDCADVDEDGDLDLFAGTQPGPVWWFRNIGARHTPIFTKGVVVAYPGRYLIGDAHSGVKVADFDGDGLPDLVTGRFWERTDLQAPDSPREFGGLHKNLGPGANPRFVRPNHRELAPYTEQFQTCDAIRQNSVRVADWDADGRRDLLAGDTDGFIWLFRNQGEARFPNFAPGEKLRAGGRLLSLAEEGGHARFDVCDWNNDGRFDLLVAGGQGKLTLFLNEGPEGQPRLKAGQPVPAQGQPIQGGARASVLACDWDNDGDKDLLFADEGGYRLHRNLGTNDKPALGAAQPITFAGQPAPYVRPNLGSWVDWDGDGRKDFIGCHFENSVRLYRNLASGQPGIDPRFADPEGVVILRASSPQMISGAEVTDWNGDGDLDILTGQGHGGSGLRFFERDWIEDELNGTHPVVTTRESRKRGTVASGEELKVGS